MKGQKLDPPLLIHIHVPKCAGTSINTMLGQQYPGRCLAYSNPTDQINFKKLSRDEKSSRYSAVFGHIKYGIHEEFDRDFVYFSILRPPLSRICSYFNYIHLTPDHPDHQLFKSKFPSLDSINREDMLNFPELKNNISNYACWAYSGQSCQHPSEWSSVSDKIHKQIENKKMILGDIELIFNFLQKCCKKNSITILPKLNQTISLTTGPLDFEFASINTLSSKSRDLFSSFNQFDQKIFDYWYKHSIEKKV